MSKDAFWANLPEILVALTGLIGGLFAGLMSLLTWWKASHIDHRVETIDAKVEVIKTQTDGLTKALVKSEKIVSRAEGVEEGKAQEKAKNGDST